MGEREEICSWKQAELYNKPKYRILGEIKLVIPGVPFSQKRHRYVQRGSFIQTYDPSSRDKKVFQEELKKQLTIYQSDTDHLPIFKEDAILSIDVLFEMPIPDSWSKKKKAQAIGFPHTKTPDLDNCMKFLQDAMNDLTYADDKQIYYFKAVKVYSPIPQTTIYISGKSCTNG